MPVPGTAAAERRARLARQSKTWRTREEEGAVNQPPQSFEGSSPSHTTIIKQKSDMQSEFELQIIDHIRAVRALVA
jgi:hypothetical protein